ncbi:hypothetical protein LTR85_003749 [Meristemomyces frigidus]|nr:hypothetical protein LTR85_003749 [Meristemomyces frigidus]
MSSNASAITTSLLLFNTDPQPLVASVISADATATAFLLNCRQGTDSNDCGTYDESVTIGAWAQTSPAPASTASGVYDVLVSMDTFTLSIHCAMSATVPATCTEVNIGGNNDGTPTVTFTSPATDDEDNGWGYLPVTITAGQEKLAAVSASATGDLSTSTALSTSSGIAPLASTTGTGSTASVTGQSSASTMSGSGMVSAASASSTSTGAAALDGASGSIGLIGLVIAWVLR